jgi:putative lipoic acid-binding regulatory protein
MTGESLLAFPCDLPIKVFGKNVAGFRSRVVNIVSSHVELVSDDQVREQLSRNKGYASLTITFRAESREQVDALFEDLTATEEIMMVL